AQDLMVVVRNEAGAFAQTSRRVRRKLVRGVDRVEDKLADLETLYDLVHGEVEDAALDVAATLRSVRRGNGVLNRVRRLIVAGRSGDSHASRSRSRAWGSCFSPFPTPRTPGRRAPTSIWVSRYSGIWASFPP